MEEVVGSADFRRSSIDAVLQCQIRGVEALPGEEREVLTQEILIAGIRVLGDE